jgi:biopolymer transport protein ExbB
MAPALIFETLWKGGWAMIPLAICSILALAIVCDKLLWGLRWSRLFPKEILQELRYLKLSEDEKLRILREKNRFESSPIGRMILSIVTSNVKTEDELFNTLQLQGRSETLRLQKNLSMLGTIAAIAPLLGLLGTVLGMIRTFSVIEQAGIGNPQLLAGGISEALVATASGIIIAVPSLVFYRSFSAKIKMIIAQFEVLSIELLQRCKS